jgi:hypothetical protein
MKFINIAKIPSKYMMPFVSGILGALVFLFIYGFVPLDVTNDEWIINGYVEKDVAQHYAGWVAFRNSDWSFPLGLANKYNFPYGMIISYTDSIPIASMFFKAVRGILPGTFQFFGIYVLLCFILQGISSSMLIGLFTNKRVNIILGTLLFLFSPIMIERAFRHTALASHFLILFSLYLLFKARKDNYTLKYGYIALGVLAISIHPYFLPIVFGLLIVALCERMIALRRILSAIVFFTACVFITLLAGYAIGVIGNGFAAEGGSFGYYSMNANAIFNPISCGNINWSAVIKTFPQILGNYDGFNYLGLGVILFSIMTIFFNLVSQKLSVKGIIKKNNILLMGCVCFTLFALSNVITFNGYQILRIPLPGKLAKIFSIFRASSRMFYPVFYLIYLSLILFVSKVFYNENTRKTISTGVILVVIFVVQIFDIRPALKTKKQSFDIAKIHEVYLYNTLYNNEIFKKAGGNTHFISLANDNYDLSVFAAKNNMLSNILCSARNFKVNENIRDRENYLQGLSAGYNYKNTTFIIDRANVWKINQIMPSFASSEYFIYPVGNYYIVMQRDDMLIQQLLSDVVPCKLTDENWNLGIAKFNTACVLFQNYPELSEAKAILTSDGGGGQARKSTGGKLWGIPMGISLFSGRSRTNRHGG